MPKKKSREVIPSSGGVFNNLGNEIKLILKLIGDSRISPFLKLLPFGSFLYLLIPDLAPGPIDDAVILWLGSVLFIELCPQDIVEEHRTEIMRTIPGQWVNPNEDEIIEGEIHDLN